MVSVSGLTPWVRSATATSSAFTKPRSTRISPRRLPVFFCSTSASRSCGVVIFFMRMRTSPSRSLLLWSVASSSCSRCGRPAPELLLVLLARVAEAAEAERAELGRVLGVVRAPDGVQGVELAQAVPARGREGFHRHGRRGTLRGGGLDGLVDDNSFCIKALHPLTLRERRVIAWASFPSPRRPSEEEAWKPRRAPAQDAR